MRFCNTTSNQTSKLLR